MSHAGLCETAGHSLSVGSTAYVADADFAREQKHGLLSGAFIAGAISLLH
jgi:hypothetical protein